MRAVVEDVAQMRAAARATNRHPLHAKALVGLRPDIEIRDKSSLEKTKRKQPFYLFDRQRSTTNLQSQNKNTKKQKRRSIRDTRISLQREFSNLIDEFLRQ